MWILFSVLCMIAIASEEMIGKKAVSKDELAPIKLRVMGITVSFLLGMLMYFLRLGESGLAPWALIAAHPIILVVVGCFVFSEFFYLFSMKYVGMTMMEAVSSLEGIVIFAGLFGIHFISGGFSAVRDMLVPARLAFLLPILICAVLLPNIEWLANRHSGIVNEKKRERKRIALGMMISLLAVILSCGDSLIQEMLLDTGAIGAVDAVMTAYSAQILLLPVFCIALVKKAKPRKANRHIINGVSMAYAILYAANILFGILAVSYDAVRSEVLFLSYPVIAILGARLVLKEKYSWRQNVCIWVIALAAIGFCVMDYVL